MTEPAPRQTRRDLVKTLAIALAAGVPDVALAQHGAHHPRIAPDAPTNARDWAWLGGSWRVEHSRLRARLAGSHAWDKFDGGCVLWQTMGGLGNVDDNVLALPDGTYRGAGIRAFDPTTRRWAIWWLDSRNPTHLDPPVLGRFDGDVGTFVGNDTLAGRPVTMRFRWSDIHGPHPRWEQAFSPDGGTTWEVNWRMRFTRLSTESRPLPASSADGTVVPPTDFDFLVGRWAVRHRRLTHRLVDSTEWEAFDGTLVNWPLLGGHGNVGDNVMNFPAGAYRGMGFRSYDPGSGEWLSWWLDGRDPLALAAPLRGRFANGVGTFVGDDTYDGKPVKVRVQWLRITPSSARWEQSSSADGGATWEVNWTSDFTRLG